MLSENCMAYSHPNCNRIRGSIIYEAHSFARWVFVRAMRQSKGNLICIWSLFSHFVRAPPHLPGLFPVIANGYNFDLFYFRSWLIKLDSCIVFGYLFALNKVGIRELPFLLGIFFKVPSKNGFVGSK